MINNKNLYLKEINFLEKIIIYSFKNLKFINDFKIINIDKLIKFFK